MENSYSAFKSYLEIEVGRSDGTITAYLSDLKRFRKYIDAHHTQQGLSPPWDQITPNHIRGYLGWLSSKRQTMTASGTMRTQNRVSGKYLHRVIASLKVWFNYLQNVEKSISQNPTQEIAQPRLEKRHPKFLTNAEVADLIKTAVEHSRVTERVRNWTMIAFLYHSGLRVSELCNMKTTDIGTKDGMPRRIRVIGKGNKERAVILNDEGSRALQTWLIERRKLMKDTPPTEDYDKVWIIPTGRKKMQALTPQGVRSTLAHIAKLSSVKKHVRPHVLRHTFASHAIQGGAKLHSLRDVLGHASIATTSVYLLCGRLRTRASGGCFTPCRRSGNSRWSVVGKRK